MTTTELIQQFIQDIGNNTWSEQDVIRYFAEMGIEIDEILGSLVSTPGIHK